MTHKRNVEGLLVSARRKHQEAVMRAEEAIIQVYQEGGTITFPRVAQAAGVSVAWLYQHREIKQRIQNLRQQQQHEHRELTQHEVSQKDGVETSKNAIIATLKQRIKELTDENRTLRKQLEVTYGQIHQLSSRGRYDHERRH